MNIRTLYHCTDWWFDSISHAVIERHLIIVDLIAVLCVNQFCLGICILIFVVASEKYSKNVDKPNIIHYRKEELIHSMIFSCNEQ